MIPSKTPLSRSVVEVGPSCLSGAPVVTHSAAATLLDSARRIAARASFCGVLEAQPDRYALERVRSAS